MWCLDYSRIFQRSDISAFLVFINQTQSKIDLWCKLVLGMSINKYQSHNQTKKWSGIRTEVDQNQTRSRPEADQKQTRSRPEAESKKVEADQKQNDWSWNIVPAKSSILNYFINNRLQKMYEKSGYQLRRILWIIIRKS